MNLAELIRREPNADTLALWIKRVPYAAFLGLRAEIRDDGELLFILPPDEKLVGNPSLPALHGGVVGAFMELAGAFHLVARMDNPVLPKIINFSLDYLRPVRLADAYACCRLTRQGRMIANVGVEVWQEDIGRPNAIARAHFLIPDDESQ
jgi:uncharacterized protein (TIGR00369 family)